MSAHGEAFAPKSRALLTDSTGVRRVTILHKVNGVGAYLVRTSAGARLTVPGSQLHPTETEARNAGFRKVIDMDAHGEAQTWADDFGWWHASVPREGTLEDQADVARRAIRAELEARGEIGEGWDLHVTYISEGLAAHTARAIFKEA